MRTAVLAGLMSAAIPAGSAFAADAAVPAAATVQLETRNIALGDLARTGGTQANPAWVLAEIPEGRSEISLSAERREQLVRRRVPELGLPLLHEGPVRFRFEGNRPAPSAGDEGRCRFLVPPVPSGTFLSRADLAEAGCGEDDIRPSVIFDRNAGALRAIRDLPAGTPLGRLDLREEQIVQPGTRMQLVIREGPVTVTREVEMLQPGLPSRRVFVRADDGETFVAPLLARGEGE